MISLRTATGTVAYAGWRVDISTGLVRWTLVIRNGTTRVVAYSTSSPLTYKWYCVELRWKNDAANGLGQLRINGSLVCSITGMNTATYGNVKQVRFGLPLVNNCAGTTAYFDYAKVGFDYIGSEP